MARNLPQRSEATTQAPMPGGSSGMMAPPKAVKIHGLNDVLPSAVDPFERDPGPKARRFRVTAGPHYSETTKAFHVLYDGQYTRLMPGKVYAENEIDLDVLRRQGVRLEEIDQDGNVVVAKSPAAPESPEAPATPPAQA